MQNPKTQIALGVTFATAWLLFGASYLALYLSDEVIASVTEVVLLEAVAFCGLMWSGGLLLRGLRRMKKENRLNETPDNPEAYSVS